MNQYLRFAAFSTYLASWLVLGIAALFNAFARRGGTSSGPPLLSPPVMLGTTLQSVAPMIITLSMGSGPLRPHPSELVAILILSPLAAGLFVWSIRSAPSKASEETLVTEGAYKWFRHPIYLAFFLMLIATGLIISARGPLLIAAILYLAGSEIRIFVEEDELLERFPTSYSQYQQQTKWRYFPGLR